MLTALMTLAGIIPALTILNIRRISMATITMGRNTMNERDREATRRFYWAVLAAIVVLFALGLMVKSGNVSRLLPENFGTTPVVVNPGP
jgi:hypothetical protein